MLSLSESAETLKQWPHRFRLQLTVRLSAASLTMTLVASNTGHAAFDFQALRVVVVVVVVVVGYYMHIPCYHARRCYTPTYYMHQALLHTYFRVDDIMGVAVRGLAGRTYVDKVDGGALKVLQARQEASRCTCTCHGTCTCPFCMCIL